MDYVSGNNFTLFRKHYANTLRSLGRLAGRDQGRNVLVSSPCGQAM